MDMLLTSFGTDDFFLVQIDPTGGVGSETGGGMTAYGY
jgi:hypothetical protein